MARDGKVIRVLCRQELDLELCSHHQYHGVALRQDAFRGIDAFLSYPPKIGQ